MTVTREQAQMLTALAIACRPHRAPTWDEAGVMAAIGKIHTWQLSEVAIRVIVAAADHEAKTPAVIVSPSMRVPDLKPPKWEPDVVAPNERCSVCSKRREDCARSPFAEHEFSPAHLVPPPRDVPAVVRALRDAKAQTATTTQAAQAATEIEETL